MHDIGSTRIAIRLTTKRDPAKRTAAGGGALLVLIAILVLGLITPARAAPADRSPLESCVAAATAAKHRQWTCVGGELLIEVDPHGNRVERIERIAPEQTDQAVVEETSEDDWSVLHIAGSAESKTALTTYSAGVVPTKGGETDDTWCESGTICTTRLSAYASKTKGNAAYGNERGAIGSYDAVIYESNTLYGNKLVNAADYYGQFRTDFVPTGYPVYHAGALHGQLFNCPTTGNCRFP